MPSNYPDNVAHFLTTVAGLVDRYNSDARGVELSQHGVEGQLNDAEAKSLAKLANIILDEINHNFDKPVSKTIAESWYQVPARFNIVKTKPHDGKSTTFTISHLNCGLHEFDFIIVGGSGIVVAERYDSLNIDW